MPVDSPPCLLWLISCSTVSTDTPRPDMGHAGGGKGERRQADPHARQEVRFAVVINVTSSVCRIRSRELSEPAAFPNYHDFLAKSGM